MTVSPNSIHARTKDAISRSVSGLITTNGYSTRQSVASVTCETRAKPSNWILSLRVNLLNLESAFLRKSYVLRNSSAKVSIDCFAAATNANTLSLPALRSSIAAIR